MSTEVYTKFLERIVHAITGRDDTCFEELIKHIDGIMPYNMCSLWKINHTSNSVSILARAKYQPSPNIHKEYVHELTDSLIYTVVAECKKKNKAYINIDLSRDNKYRRSHRSPERISARNLKRLLSIPIPYSDGSSQSEKFGAVLNIYVDEKARPQKGKIEFIRDIFALALSNVRKAMQDMAAQDIMALYRKKEQKDLASFMHALIGEIISKYIPCEGCSVFILDPHSLSFVLSATTGIQGNARKSEIRYFVGEGITGHIAESNRPQMINDLQVPSAAHGETISKYKHKYGEVTKQNAKSFLGIPLRKPGNQNRVIGVLRLVNRLNSLSHVLDNFNNDDLELLDKISVLLSFIIEIDEVKRQQAAFAVHLKHETKSPAAYIMNAATKLFESIQMQADNREETLKFLGRIIHRSRGLINFSYAIQIIASKTIEDEAKNVYQVQSVNVKDVVYKSMITCISDFRAQNLSLENVKISSQKDKISFFFDQYALERVFVNIFSNSIKYSDKSNKPSFRIDVKLYAQGRYRIPLCRGAPDTVERTGYLVQISDHGLGIPSSIADDIFKMGFRHIPSGSPPGSGIGLTLVDEILADFSCFIWVSSFVHPTEFSIFFPIALSSRSAVKEILKMGRA